MLFFYWQCQSVTIGVKTSFPLSLISYQSLSVGLCVCESIGMCLCECKCACVSVCASVDLQVCVGACVSVCVCACMKDVRGPVTVHVNRRWWYVSMP